MREGGGCGKKGHAKGVCSKSIRASSPLFSRAGARTSNACNRVHSLAISLKSTCRLLAALPRERRLVAMDAASCLAVSALQVATTQHEPAAMSQLLQDFERRSMEAEDLRSRCRDLLIAWAQDHGMVHAAAQEALREVHEAAAAHEAENVSTGDTDTEEEDVEMDENADAETTQRLDVDACVGCRVPPLVSDSPFRQFYKILPARRLFPPRFLIVCSQCYRPSMGEIWARLIRA